jgi:hypothetical protein
MSHIPLFKRPLLILSIVSFIATLSIGGYFYLQQKSVETEQINTPAIPKITPIAVDSIKLPAAAEVLTDLFGTKTTADKINNVPDQISSLWFAQSFSHGNNDFYAVFVKSQTIDPDSKQIVDSHASSATVNIVVYKKIAAQWQLFSKQINVGSFGSWGDVPEIKHVPTLQLSADNLAFLIEGGSSGQGYTEIGKGLFSYNLKTKTWKDLGFVSIGGDNAGACDDSPQPEDSVLSACWKFSGEITLTKSGKNPDYPDLLVIEKGTTSDDNNKIIPVTNRMYIFNGEQYLDPSAEAR